ncbi:hypothetical protein [Klebsiella michiganensis]|nr:hypothetical protein [Klebsiella michiganensis]
MTDSYTDGFLTGRANGLLTWRNTNFCGSRQNHGRYRTPR